MKVSGVIVDSDTNQTVPGVEVRFLVLEQDSIFKLAQFRLRNSEVTDSEGRFQFAAPSGAEIQLELGDLISG